LLNTRSASAARARSSSSSSFFVFPITTGPCSLSGSVVLVTVKPPNGSDPSPPNTGPCGRLRLNASLIRGQTARHNSFGASTAAIYPFPASSAAFRFKFSHPSAASFIRCTSSSDSSVPGPKLCSS